MKYILAHDIGTSGNKASLFSIDGRLVNSATIAYDTKWFNSTWAEQDPNKWYRAVCQSTKKLLETVAPQDIMAVSFSGQMMGCLCVDEKGVPLDNSIIWADMRAEEEAQQVREKFDEADFYNTTGHRISSSYTLEKLMWVKKHKPEIYGNTHKVLNSKDYVAYKLTGNFCTDYSDASGTHLLNLKSLRWDERIAEALEIDIAKMPRLKRSIDQVGEVIQIAAEETGLQAGTPVIMGGGDGSVSALGALCIHEGDVFTTIGTSAWNSIATNAPHFDSEMKTFNWVHVVPDLYLVSGTMQTAGAAINWIKRELEDDVEEEKFYRLLEELASSSPLGSRGVIFLPYLQGERSPRWNSRARGSFVGLKMETTKGDLCRAVLEGIAYNLKIILDLIDSNKDSTQIKELVLTGGVCESPMIKRIISDVFDCTIRIPNYLEGATSFGAALIAGVGVGAFKNFDAINQFIEIKETITPKPEHAQYYRRGLRVFNELYAGLCQSFDMLAELDSAPT